MKREKIPKLVYLVNPSSPFAEAYRTLRTNIQYARVTKPFRSLMVTSADPNEGKTTTVANLALAMAQSGNKVLLVDADLRKPTIHKIFRLPNELGLTNLLVQDREIEDIVHNMKDFTLDIVTAGPKLPNPAELLGSQRMAELLKRFERRYDMVLIDTPPVLLVTDGQLLAGHAEAVLMVLKCGKVSRAKLKKAKLLLEHVGANLIGTVLNHKKIDMSHEAYYYGEDG